MENSRKLFFLFFGNPEKAVLEDQIPLILSFSTATLSLVAATVNLILGLSPLVIFIPFCAALLMFFVHYKLLKSARKNLYKMLMALIAFLYFNFLWFYNSASHGPTLYLFLLFFIFIIMIFDGKTRVVLAASLLVNILLLLLFELNFSNRIVLYADEETRILDVYLSVFIYLAFSSILALVVRYFYRMERNKAKKSDQLKSAFLSNMSHEIRTPMSAILGFSKLLDYAETEKERNDYVEIINKNGKLLMQLLDDIIDISRMDVGQFDISIKVFSLNTVMEELKKATRLSLDQQKKQNVRLKLIIQKGDIAILSDENRLRQIMFNLLSNAVKYTDKGEIGFGYSLHGNDIECFVADTGLGIKEQNKKDVFTRFYKIDDEDYTYLPGGSGIGLSIVKSLVEKLGGRIEFDSEYGKGSTFRFYLPGVLHEVIHEPEEVKSTIYIFSSRNKVLVAEDDDSNMKLIVNMLKKMGLSCLQATNGVEALKIYNSHPEINLVLMDISMPEMNGFDALKKLKLIRPSLPVVALTAYAMAEDREKAVSAGFDDYLTKPIYQNSLAECLRKYLILQVKKVQG